MPYVMAADLLVYAQLFAAGIGMAPFAWHRLSCMRWMKKSLDMPEEDSNLPITVLLPVWNEALIIEKKISRYS